jgi:flavin-dependent dehydrogenase
VTTTPPPAYDADVIVVGAGPAGSATAFHLAQRGLDVLVLEKTAFPREKVCGDGLTPRAVKQLVEMGIDTGPEAGWARNVGLRIIGGGHRLEMRWPDLATFPDYGLTRTRKDFDEILARQAEKAGARLLERTTVTGPVRDDRSGRIVGVTARTTDADGTKHGEVAYRAPLVVAADGNSSRLSVAAGRERLENRPMGVAVRTYYRSEA